MTPSTASADVCQTCTVYSPGLSGACPTCQSTWGVPPRTFYALVHRGEVFDEGGFSSSPCGLCGSILGGNRYVAHGVNLDTHEVSHIEVCVDCLMTLA